MDDRQMRRVAENESRFRAANERIVHDTLEFNALADDRPVEIMCECPITECRDMLELTVDEYRRIRAIDTHFVVLPDHVLDAAERLVERTDSHWVIEKVDLGADVARDLA